MIVDYEEKELDRKESSRNVYGLRSLLGADMCPECGAEPGTRGVIAWWDDDENRYTEVCPFCNDREVMPHNN